MNGQRAVDITGIVLEADLKLKRFQLWLDDRVRAVVGFTESQEELVTTALKEHRVVRVRVRGRGQYSVTGKLTSVTDVKDLTLLPADRKEYNQNAQPIEETIREIAARVPESEWRKIPTDLSVNLDHYLYGAPKR